MNNESTTQRMTFLVLMDFSESSYKALKYSISMAKLTKGQIHVCHIGNPGNVVGSDNQLVALRAVESENYKVEDKLNSIVEIIKAEGISAKGHHANGNLVSELKSLIYHLNPTIVVIGDKNKKALFNSELTGYLLNKYNGHLLIVKSDYDFVTDTTLAFGCNESTLYRFPPELIYELDQHTKPTLKLININKPNVKAEIIDLPKAWRSRYTHNLNIQIEKKENISIAEGLNKFISDEYVQLLVIGRGLQKNPIQRLFSKPTIISQIIKEVKIPVLLMGNNREEKN